MAIWTGSNDKSYNSDLRYEFHLTAIWGKFLRFGLRDFKSLEICDLRFGAPSPEEIQRIASVHILQGEMLVN